MTTWTIVKAWLIINAIDFVVSVVLAALVIGGITWWQGRRRA